MKQGFMLIELIIATLISSLVAGVLFALLFQSSRVQTSVDTVIDLSVRVGVVENQLEKDLSGAFIPMQAQEQKSSSVASKGSSEKQEESSSAEATADTSKDVKKPKVIEKIFYSINKNEQLDTLTFVTNNPLVVYVGKDVGVVKPKVARVQYTLKPEENKKDSYALFRQESTELDLENYKNVTPYEVIGGIKKCTVIFTAKIVKQSSGKAPEGAQEAKKEYEYKTQNEWVSEQKKSSSAEATADRDNKEKTEFPRIPYSVEMKLLLWDLQEKKEKEFTVVCEIPTDFSPIKKQQEKKPEQPKKEEKPAEQPAEGTPPVPQVAQNIKQTTKEIIKVVDRATGKVVYEAEKNANTMNEIQKLFGHA